MFLNYEESIKYLKSITRQNINEFTLMHFLSNGYLNAYLAYDGELCSKMYDVLSKDIDDFTIFSTEVYTGYLVLNDEGHHSFLSQILIDDKTVNIANFFKISDFKIYSPLVAGTHINYKGISMEDLNAYIEMLEACGEPVQKNITGMKGKELNLKKIIRNLSINKKDLLFSIEEMNSIPLSHHALNRSGQFYASELGLALELWEEIYLSRKGLFKEGQNLERVINELLENYEISSSKLKSKKADNDETGRLKSRLKVMLNLTAKNKSTKKETES